MCGTWTPESSINRTTTRPWYLQLSMCASSWEYIQAFSPTTKPTVRRLFKASFVSCKCTMASSHSTVFYKVYVNDRKQNPGQCEHDSAGKEKEYQSKIPSVLLLSLFVALGTCTIDILIT